VPVSPFDELRRETNEGLNVIESWNSANDFIFGKGGEMASNRADDQEISMLSLHLVQLSLVYVNTLMIQQVLAEPAWQHRLNVHDLRDLTPLIYGHVNPMAASGWTWLYGCPSTRLTSVPNQLERNSCSATTSRLPLVTAMLVYPF